MSSCHGMVPITKLSLNCLLGLTGLTELLWSLPGRHIFQLSKNGCAFSVDPLQFCNSFLKVWLRELNPVTRNGLTSAGCRGNITPYSLTFPALYIYSHVSPLSHSTVLRANLHLVTTMTSMSFSVPDFQDAAPI